LALLQGTGDAVLLFEFGRGIEGREDNEKGVAEGVRDEGVEL
jgi:hypothetical protein